MEVRRAQKSIYNMATSITYSMIMIIFRFVIRKLFLDAFGVTILGYNSTFNSVVGMLNLAELGIGTAVTFNLYEPIAEGRFDKVNGFLKIYRKLYYVIGGVILALGIMIVPVLPQIVKDENTEILYLGAIFILQLLSTVASYWFAYKRIVYTVYQDSYFMYIIDISVYVVINVIQIVCLFTLKSYYLYLILEIVNIVLSNLILSIMCKKKYPHIFSTFDDEYRDIKIREFFKDIKNVIISKMGGYVLNSTDAVVVSTIMGAAATGYMTNYSTVFASFQSMILSMLTSIQPSLGNMIYTDKNKHHVEETVVNITFLSQCIASIFSVVFFFIVNQFITIWVGNAYLLDAATVFFFALNVYVYIVMYPISLLFGALGYFKYDKLIICFSALINIVVSIILVSTKGIYGVLVGTTIALMIYWICRTIILYDRYYGFKPIVYLKMVLRCFLTTILSFGTVLLINASWKTADSSITHFLAKGIVYSAIVAIINILIFRNTLCFKYMIALIKSIRKRGEKP